MKRLYAIVFLFCLLVFVLSANAQTGKPKMLIEQPVYDAGDVYKSGEKLEHAFVIKNTGDADLTIYDARPG